MSKKTDQESGGLEFWSMPADEVLNHFFVTKEKGLSDEDYQERLDKYGPNKVDSKEGNTKFEILWRQVSSPLIFILLIASVVTFVLGEYFDSGLIVFAILVNTALGFYQEYKADTAVSHLQSFIKVSTRVLRNGKEFEVDATELVPGDIVHLTRGRRVPADGRVIRSSNLRIDEAVLTGESISVIKDKTLLGAQTLLADRKNMVFGGTLIAEGSGWVVITATANNTEFGKIAGLVTSTKREQTPLQKAVAKLAWSITIIISVLVTLVFVLGVSRGESIFEMFLVSIAVAVGAIPEALPIGLTAVLAVGVERLAKRKGIMRSLTAAETLGSTTVIMTDKTGTLTEARLQLVDVMPKQELLSSDVVKEGGRLEDLNQEETDLLKLAVFGTDVAVENPEDNYKDWRLSGSPLEISVVETAAEKGVEFGLGKNDLFKNVIPFSSVYKFSVSEGLLDNSYNIQSIENGYIQIVLGAPDVLLKRCEIEKQEYSDLMDSIETQSAAGKRLVGVAIRRIKTAGNTHGRPVVSDIEDLEFVGVLAFFDPIRKEVPEAMRMIEGYGVKVIMATGDLPGTATSIARDLGWPVENGDVLTGEDLSLMTEEELDKSLDSIRVFARVTPKDKLRIAKLLQARGEVVSMTGDGVNDSPSLKAVDIGIAVGSGSDVAKAVADLVLLDDNFKTIVVAIEEGKRLLRNIRKTFIYLMSTCLDGVVLIGGSLILGLPIPLTAMQIIWVNFITDGLPAISFAFDEDLDKGGAKPVSDTNIINSRVIYLTLFIGLATAGILFGIYNVLLHLNYDELTVKTFIFTCFASYTLFQTYSFRSLSRPIFTYSIFGNKIMNASVVFGLLMLSLTLYVPIFNEVFDTVPLNGWWLGGVLLWLVASQATVETAKYLFKDKVNK